MVVEEIRGACGLSVFQWKQGWANDGGAGSTSGQFGR